MMGALWTVFTKPRYVLVAVLVALCVFVFAVWLPNISLIISVLTSDVGTITEKVAFVFSLLGSITTNFTAVSAVSTILIAISFGMNVALLMYYIRKVRIGRNVSTVGGASIAGLVSGFLGVGCAACGTFILSSVLVLAGAGGVLSYLPFGGEEFGFTGIILLVYSSFSLVQRIQKPDVCKLLIS